MDWIACLTWASSSNVTVTRQSSSSTGRLYRSSARVRLGRRTFCHGGPGSAIGSAWPARRHRHQSPRHPTRGGGTMGSALKSATVAFLVAGEGAQQSELQQPWQAVIEEGGRPVLVS